MCIRHTPSVPAASASMAPARAQCSHIIDQVRPDARSAAHQLGVGGVDGDQAGDPSRGDALDHRQYPAQLLLARYRRRPGRVDSPTDIDDGRPLLNHALGLRQRRIRLQIPATIGERVGVTLSTPMTTGVAGPALDQHS
jgi:hypothetical protein